MNGLTYLMLAIISEVIATTMLKASDGFSRLYPSIVVVIGYCLSFWALSQVVRVMPLGIAYAIWSGLGIVLVSVAAVFLYQQKLDLPAIVGMALIIAGVLVINLLSKSASH
ncbi:MULTISPECIES: SMR family transporter [Proteus]|uniref:SMR family transporter n=1 Tax=Proteus appendicitidis TaxID=3034648 RepID=A0ABY8Y3J3_9GAMM|nr:MULTISPECIES: SMR family transporter [Proteus]ATN00311.1 multidrug DMT transporter [Proteus vulgaris]MBG6027460.1 QacE family quaternary ammonium compound efflux SMR transporter [Proteus mirabilis]MBG2835891.1 QacE family quaternary ammonium compound efflux SMR transporter [Proteus terrae subsp. cibarius]MBG2867465.1 QacE family quaternary ammonium compound efflux SMR transporter [Proteus terrae subsp. cibarius]MBG6049203.1 QacE family quaternary ammonium compound efflux SMR transporter [Pr